MQNYRYENDFDLHENENAGGANFHKNGFALRLILEQRHNRTRKWPILVSYNVIMKKFKGKSGKAIDFRINVV